MIVASGLPPYVWASDCRHIPRRAFSLLSLLVLVSFLAVTRADGDLWGHLLFGRDIARDGAVHQTDPYSFTSDTPWVNHEWAAELAMWLAYRAGGAAGLVALKLWLVALAGLVLVEAWRDHDLSSPQRDALLCAAALGAWPQFATMRPQSFSIPAFALLLLILIRNRLQPGRSFWVLPLLFAVWVNFHGGWVVGAGVLAIYTALSLGDSELPREHKRKVVLVVCLCAVAVLCNPYGWKMLAFLGQTVRPTRGDVVEWRNLSQLPGIAFGLWLIPAVVAAIAYSRARGAVCSFAIATIIALGIGSLCVARLVGFFTVAAVALVGPLAYGQLRRDMPAGQGRAQLLAATSGVAVLIALATLMCGRTIRMDGDWLPEPDAAQAIRSAGLSGRMLTWFDYGEYAIWHLSPNIRVSMDGRRETVYSEDMRRKHAAVYAGTEEGLLVVDELRPDYVWLPNAARVLPRLQRAGWRPVFSGCRSTVLARSDSAIQLLPAANCSASVSPRVFPGP